jgi:molybdate transport system regulatory protein
VLQVTIWLIGGACSGVGKTFVAKRLCAVLPDVVYAKLGHGAANYFTNQQALDRFICRQEPAVRHLVIESTSYEVGGAHVIRVFLQAGHGATDVREDARRQEAAADVLIGRRAAVKEWLAVIKRHVKDEALARAICGIFAEQKRLLVSGKIAVRSKVWLINQHNELVFGAGLASLIEDVEHLGSLRAAAERASMSYRHAWGAIKDAEQHLGFKLLLPSAGGSHGGGSQLTAAGKRLLALYRRLSEAAAAAADRELARRYVENWGGDGG